MDYKCDDMFNFGELNLYFETHVAGLDGECFYYSVYFNDGVSDEKIAEISKAIADWSAPYDEKDIYTGYISVSKEDDKASIYLDLGNVEDCDTSINGIMTALNNVTGIKSVILNEDCECDF